MNKTFSHFLLLWAVAARRFYKNPYLKLPEEGSSAHKCLKGAFEQAIEHRIPLSVYVQAQVESYAPRFPYPGQFKGTVALQHALRKHSETRDIKAAKDNPVKLAKATHGERTKKYRSRWYTFINEDWSEDDWCVGSDNEDYKIVLYRLDKYWYLKMDKPDLYKRLRRRLKRLYKEKNFSII